MTAADIARALGGAKRHGVEWDARCPAHDDANPSLSLREGDDGKILFRCHAGCSQQQVFDALRARGLLERRSNGHDHQPRATPKPARTTDEVEQSLLRDLMLFSGCPWVTAWQRAGWEVQAQPRSHHRRSSPAAPMGTLRPRLVHPSV